MLRIPLAVGTVALCLAVPAFAQGTTPAPAAPAAAPASQTGAMSSGASSMTCDQMIAKAQSMTTHGSGAQMTMMQNQLSMAQRAKAANDDAGCKMHARKAMDVMK